MQLIENDIAEWKAKSEAVAVFHTNAGHVTLKDSSYNTDRNVTTGNPYKALVADLMKRGVHIERSARHEPRKKSFRIIMATVPVAVYCDKSQDLL